MSDMTELRAARRRWRQKESEEELLVYRLILGETPETPNDFLVKYEEGRVIPKLAIAAFQIRDHSRNLIRWTWVLVGSTIVLAALTATLLYVSLKG